MSDISCKGKDPDKPTFYEANLFTIQPIRRLKWWLTDLWCNFDDCIEMPDPFGSILYIKTSWEDIKTSPFDDIWEHVDMWKDESWDAGIDRDFVIIFFVNLQYKFEVDGQVVYAMGNTARWYALVNKALKKKGYLRETIIEKEERVVFEEVKEDIENVGLPPLKDIKIGVSHEKIWVAFVFDRTKFIEWLSEKRRGIYEDDHFDAMTCHDTVEALYTYPYDDVILCRKPSKKCEEYLKEHDFVIKESNGEYITYPKVFEIDEKKWEEEHNYTEEDLLREIIEEDIVDDEDEGDDRDYMDEGDLDV